MAVNEWDRRELCPDGSCTGLIGPDGTCKVCGHAAPNWGDERKRGTIDDDDGDDGDDDGRASDPIAPAAKAELGGGEWAMRQLCVDGSCTGLIGADGRCKVCGTPGAAPVAGAGDGGAEDDDEGDDDADDDDDDDSDGGHDDNDNDNDDDDADDSDVNAGDGGDEDADDSDADDDAALEAAADELAGLKPIGAVSGRDEDDEDDEDDDRKLCPDGGCIGVIGPDGKCKVCGKDAA